MTTTRSRLTSAITAGLLTVLALGVLSACGGEQTAQGNGSGGAGSSSEQPPTNDETVDTDSDSDTAQNASPTGCLVGTWLADNKRLGALFKSAAAGTDAAGAVSDPTGKVLMTFGPEGQYSVNYQQWTMKVSQEGMTIELVREGTDKGSYEATDDGTVEWTEVTMGSVATMKSPGGAFEVAGDPSGASGTFVCEADTLEITAEDSMSVFDRQ